jgi:hypothetical protein
MAKSRFSSRKKVIVLVFGVILVITGILIVITVQPGVIPVVNSYEISAVAPSQIVQSVDSIIHSTSLRNIPVPPPPIITDSPTNEATTRPSPIPTQPLKPKKVLRLISLNKPVKASVRGNLGPPEVVTNENVEDWLTDRWQGETLPFHCLLLSG